MHIVTFEEAAELLAQGAVGVIPTDTVYGLVTRAEDEAAVTRMYALKHREQKPGTLIAANTDQLLALGVPQDEINKVAKYWPSPLSAVLPITKKDNPLTDEIKCEYLHQGIGTLAMRVVANEDIRTLLERTGPLITSSANQPGEPPATNINEAMAYFGDGVDFYVDGGTIKDVLPSTIVRPTKDGVEVLRQGSISL